MAEHSGVAEGGFILAKVMASPGAIGIIAAGIAFMFKWPKTAREGVPRVIAHAACVYFFGDPVLRTIVHFAEWIPVEEMRIGAYLIAGLPGWFLLHGLFAYFKRNEDKDLKQVVKDVKDVL